MITVVHRIVVIAATVMAATAAGVLGAGAASVSKPASPAATQPYAALCNDVFGGAAVNHCAQAKGQSKVVGVALVPPTHPTNWYYPWRDQTPGYTQIKQANTDLCMQLDHAKGNVVIEAKCSTSYAQQWGTVYVAFPSTMDYMMFSSRWDPSLCLADNVYTKEFVAAKCTTAVVPNAHWEQFFGA